MFTPNVRGMNQNPRLVMSECSFPLFLFLFLHLPIAAPMQSSFPMEKPFSLPWDRWGFDVFPPLWVLQVGRICTSVSWEDPKSSPTFPTTIIPIKTPFGCIPPAP